MKLVSVYDTMKAPAVLYELLLEREPYQSISHKEMPTEGEHMRFWLSKPYLYWYLIAVNDEFVGACYMTHQREIGIGILKRHQGNGYGREAVQMMMRFHGGPFLANINPANQKSIDMFTDLGFRHIQNTYSHE